MMDEINQNHTRRWYDQIANMTMAVYVSQKLPEEIQGIIARNLNEYIDTYRQMKRNDKHAVSLGSTRAMGMYKASNRQRWYDPHQSLHRAYTHMGTIPDFFLSEYALRIIDVSTYLKYPTALSYQSHTDDIVDAVESILKKNFVSLEEDSGGIKLVQNTIEIPGAGPGHHNPRHIVSLPHKQHRPTKR